MPAWPRLSTEYRQILVLREIDGCRYDEIAEILELPVGTVRSRLFRARIATARPACAAIPRRTNRGHPMSDYDRQPELDDELLSAYLDDELSPEERAAVEARLAADPSAQQLLHQLRAVCEAVQALPQEVVGHDMRESILHKAEERETIGPLGRMRSAGEHADPSNGQPVTALDDAPKFTFGRTRRGWVWASLAIAAALLIMVFGREPERDQLADVAQNEDRLSDARGGAIIWNFEQSTNPRRRLPNPTRRRHPTTAWLG